MDLDINTKYLILLLALSNIIYFYILLPRQNITRKGRVDKNNVAKLDTNNDNGRKYKVEAI